MFGFFMLFDSSFSAFAQQGIGITTPAHSAMLDVTVSGKGALVPRMSTAQRMAIPSPATGLPVFDNTTFSFWFF